MHKVLVMLLLLIAAPVAMAQDLLDVQSDSLSIDNKTNTAVFTGNVAVTRDGITMTADKVKVTYSQKGQQAGTSDDVEQVEATGHVKIVDGKRVITSRRAVYNLPADQMTLIDDVVVTEGAENTIKGTKMLYDMTQGLITMSADTGRVKAKLVPSK